MARASVAASVAAASTGGVAEGGAGGGGGAELLLGTPDARAAHRGRPRLGPHGTVCRPPTPALGRQATGPQLHRSQPRATATAHRVSSRSGLYSRRCDKYVLGCFDFAFLAPPAAEQVLESRSNRSCKGVCTCCIYVRVIVCARCARARRGFVGSGDLSHAAQVGCQHFRTLHSSLRVSRVHVSGVVRSGRVCVQVHPPGAAL